MPTMIIKAIERSFREVFMRFFRTNFVLNVAIYTFTLISTFTFFFTFQKSKNIKNQAF